MSVFNVPVVIGVDETKIAKEIEAEAKSMVFNNITEEVKSIMYSQSYYGRNASNEPLKNMVKGEIARIIDDKEEEIVEVAAKLLADKMAKTKAVKEAIAKVIDETTGEDE